MIKKILIIILFFVIADKNSFADFIYQLPDKKGELSAIVISGTIKPGDYDEFVGILRKFHKMDSLPSLRIYLKSDGGDVYESVRIGNLIRKLRLETTTSPTGYCGSSCFLIYVAGIERSSFIPPNRKKDQESALVLHRPRFHYSLFSGLSSEEANKKYNELFSDVSRYLESMSTPKHIIEKMFSIPSNEYYIVPIDVAISELSGMEKSYQEWLISKCGSYTTDDKVQYIRLAVKKNRNENENLYMSVIEKIDTCYDSVWKNDTEEQAKNFFKD